MRPEAAAPERGSGEGPARGPQGPVWGPVRFGLALLCAAMLLGMMGLTVADVIGRYLLNAPILGASEVTEILLVATVYVGLIAVCLDRAHVTVDLVVERLPPHWQRPREAVVDGVSGLVLLLVAWRLWAYGQQFAGYGGTTNTLAIPLAPVAWLCAACTLVAAILTFIDAARGRKP